MNRELWIPLGAVGFKNRKGTEFVILRKLKRGGYSYRYAERLFSGYVHASKTFHAGDWREFLENVDASTQDILTALERAEEKELWQEELEFLKGLLEKPAEKKAATTRQATLVGVVL